MTDTRRSYAVEVEVVTHVTTTTTVRVDNAPDEAAARRAVDHNWHVYKFSLLAPVRESSVVESVDVKSVKPL